MPHLLESQNERGVPGPRPPPGPPPPCAKPHEGSPADTRRTDMASQRRELSARLAAVQTQLSSTRSSLAGTLAQQRQQQQSERQQQPPQYGQQHAFRSGGASNIRGANNSHARSSAAPHAAVASSAAPARLRGPRKRPREEEDAGDQTDDVEAESLLPAGLLNDDEGGGGGGGGEERSDEGRGGSSDSHEYDYDEGDDGPHQHDPDRHADPDPRQTLHALADRLQRQPCPKGGTAVGGVRVETKQVDGGRWRCRVLTKCRRKRKSKEKPAELRCIASATQKLKADAELRAVREAVGILRSIDIGETDVRDISNKQQNRIARLEDDISKAGSGQPGWRVLSFVTGNQGKKKKRRVDGAPKRHAIIVLGPNGKEAQYDAGTLRGLQVRPGDQLVYHQGQGKRARPFFTRATR